MINNILFFDCETTGVTRRDKVINFGSITVQVDTEKKAYKCIDSCDIYNKVDVEIPLSLITNVHGITPKILEELSNGIYYWDMQDYINALLECNKYLAVYSTKFDIRLINQTYNSEHRFDTWVAKEYDVKKLTYAYFNRQISLLDSFNAFNFENVEQQFREMTENCFTTYNLENVDPSVNAHRALYDTYMTVRVWAAILGYEYEPTGI